MYMKYFCKNCQSYTERDKKKCCPECGVNLKDASVAPSTIIAGFQIIEEIGRGSNGVVYLAEQTSLDRKVALKILPDAKAEDPGFVKAFLKEARAAARLNHPNIIQAYDAGVTGDGIYFLAMELIDGRSLEEHIQSKGAMKAKNAIKIALELAKALEYSWNKEHLFHGDIKPDNIMIRKDGHSKLADFGLAKTIFDDKSDEIMATPMYAPPEVIRGQHKKIGFKSDMYSFGVTFYEILCGKPPFDEADCEKVLAMHLRKNHIPLIERMPEIDRSLSDLIDKLLSKKPKQRPQDWTSVIESLEEIQTNKARHRRKLRLIAGISLSLVICGLAIAGFLYYEKNKKKEVLKPVPKLTITPKPLPPPKVHTVPAIKIKPAAKALETEKISRSHSELKKLLKAAKNLKADILTVSRLRFRALKLQKNNSLPGTEQTKLNACIAKLNRHIRRTRHTITKRETARFRLELKKEREITEKKRSRERDKNLLIAKQNEIFKLVIKFLSNNRKQQTVRTLQTLLEQTRNLDKKLPEYKALAFLLKVLPHRYNREGVIFEHLDQLIGKTLPWKIRRREYTIIGGSWQSMHLQTQLSKGVFSRKKLRATQLRDYHWCLLVNEFLVKGSIKSTPKNIQNTACWLLLNSKEKLFRAFVQKYYPNDLSDWLNCRRVIITAPSELAAYTSWRNIVAQMAELNQMAYKSINDFKTKYADTGVYKNVQDILLDYQKTVYAIYLEAFVDQLQITSLSIKSSDSKVFSAQNRYRFLNSLASGTRIFLRTLFNKKLRLLSGDQEFAGQFGIFENVPCGKVYSWIMLSSKDTRYYPLRYVPAMLDIDAWNYIKRTLKKTPELKLDSLQIKENTKQYPFFLYSAGLVALRYGKWETLDKIFSNFKKLITPDDIDSSFRHALFADLALKTRCDQYAREVLDKYDFRKKTQTDEIIISLLKIQTLLTQKPLDEPAVAELISTTQKRFAANSALRGDLRVLTLLRQLICADFKQYSSIKTELFKQTTYPHLHARLWLEAAARDKILRRNSIKIPALLKACRSILTPSAFRSDLFHKITSLSLGYKNFTPAQLRRDLNKSLLELKPCATNSYPALLTLMFAAELFDRRLPAGKLNLFARAYTLQCPIFSPVERRFCDIPGNSDSLKILQSCQKFNPITFQKLYLWMLAAAKAKRSGDAGIYIKKLKSFRKDLRWTEQLFLDRFIELLENSTG